MNLLGKRVYPCGHHKVYPDTPGEGSRRCVECRVVHRFVVERSEVASARRWGADSWRIRWLPVSPTVAADAVESGQLANASGGGAASTARPPARPTEEVRHG